MHLHSYHLTNFRRLRDVHVELAPDISIFVGANNSGKTSATQAIQMFLSGAKEKFSLYDFSSNAWKALKELSDLAPDADAAAKVPGIVLDLWFEVSAADLYLVIPILPSSNWNGTQVGVRIEFGARNVPELLQRYRSTKAKAQEQAARINGGAGVYVPWPKSLPDYLEKELPREFEFRYYVLDRTQFDDNLLENPGYTPALMVSDPGGASTLKSLVRIDCLHAQRHLADPAATGTTGVGRSEDLSKRLSRFYHRNLAQRDEDHGALKALAESEDGINKHLMEVFDDTLTRIATLGYPGLHNPRLQIKSALNPASIMSHDARVHYIVGEGEHAVALPDSYNGLGFKNLIYMVVEILDLQEKWRADEYRAPLHIIFIEEPEAHLHAQLQQVFIRNVLSLLDNAGDADGIFASQVVVTTHSPHILYERGFEPIRYFRRHVTDGEHTTQVLNLSRFQAGPNPKDRDFLQRYLKLTHCDLFFADAAILVEGNVERLLLPIMIEKEAKALRSAALCILEVGGAFGHRFKELIEFLGITTLIITDIDSVMPKAEAAEVDDEEDEEFEIPPDEPGGQPKKQFGKACLPATLNAVTSNQTLIQWLPKKQTIADLFAADDNTKSQALEGCDPAMVRVVYQVPTEVTWNEEVTRLCGRTLEEAFGLENATWCQAADRKGLGLKMKAAPAAPGQLAEGLHKRVKGKSFNKTKFALGVLGEDPKQWDVPLYIKEGLHWLKQRIALEVEQEAEAVPEIIAEAVGIEGGGDELVQQ